MFENYKVYETTIAGRPFRLETGKMAGLANAAFMASYGETNVLCTVTASRVLISSLFQLILKKKCTR